MVCGMTHPPADPSLTPANRLERAREVVRGYELPAALRAYGQPDVGRYADPDASLLYYDGQRTQFLVGEVTAEVLAQSLLYVVDFDLTPVDDEATVPLGTSKYNGLPHLPPGFGWPPGQYFALQLNLAEFHPHDVHDVFPADGMLYIFLTMSSLDVTVVHYGGSLDVLRVTEYPDRSALPDAQYYLADFLKRSSLVRFTPHGIFHLGGDAYDQSAARALIPPDLVDRAAEALGAPIVWRSSGLNLFGRPLYWQGEDEDWGELVEDDGDAAPHRPAILLFQDEIGEASVHVWVSPEDARRRDYSACWSDASCT